VGVGVGGGGSGSGGLWGGSRVWVSAGMTTDDRSKVGCRGEKWGRIRCIMVDAEKPEHVRAKRASSARRSDRIVRLGRGARSEDGKNHPRGLKRLGQGLGLGRRGREHANQDTNTPVLMARDAATFERVNAAAAPAKAPAQSDSGKVH
jgi:hypothetical protein